jgi:hypothetical protein
MGAALPAIRLLKAQPRLENGHKKLFNALFTRPLPISSGRCKVVLKHIEVLAITFARPLEEVHKRLEKATIL